MSLETFPETSVSLRIKCPLKFFNCNQKNLTRCHVMAKHFNAKFQKHTYGCYLVLTCGETSIYGEYKKAKNAANFIPGELHHIAHSTNAYLCEIHKNFFFHCFLNKSLWDTKIVHHSRNIKIPVFKFLNILRNILKILHITKISIPTKLKVQSYPDIVTPLFRAHESL
jgi:hypothetical protein